MIDDKEFLSVREFKDRAGVSSNLVYEQLRKGVLPSVMARTSWSWTSKEWRA